MTMSLRVAITIFLSNCFFWSSSFATIDVDKNRPAFQAYSAAEELESRLGGDAAISKYLVAANLYHHAALQRVSQLDGQDYFLISNASKRLLYLQFERPEHFVELEPEDFSAVNAYAYVMLRNAAESGDMSAQLYLAYLCSQGVFECGQIDTDFYWTLRAAEFGNYSAMDYVSVSYYQGDGVSQDKLQSAAWAAVGTCKWYLKNGRQKTDIFTESLSLISDRNNAYSELEKELILIRARYLVGSYGVENVDNASIDVCIRDFVVGITSDL